MNEVFEIDNLKTAVSIIKKFEGNKFITFEKDEESVEAYAKKQLELNTASFHVWNRKPFTRSF